MGTIFGGVAVIGLVLDRDAKEVLAFLFMGAILWLVAVFEPRMEGKQQLGVQGATLNLARSVEVRRAIDRAELDLASGRVLRPEDIPDA